MRTLNSLEVLEADGTWTTHPLEEYGRVRDFVKDEKGRLWMLTSQGLRARDPSGSWTIYTAGNSGLVSDDVLSLAFDDFGRVWVGTREGLSMLDLDGTWATYLPDIGEDPSLTRNNVRDMVFDNQGHLWLYTSAGLSKFDEISSTDRDVLRPYETAESTLLLLRNIVAVIFVLLLVAYESLIRRESIKCLVIGQATGIGLMIWAFLSIPVLELLGSDLGGFVFSLYPGVSIVLWLWAGFRRPETAIYTALLGTSGYGLNLLYLWFQFNREAFDPLSGTGMALATVGYGVMALACFLLVHLGAIASKWNKRKGENQEEENQ